MTTMKGKLLKEWYLRVVILIGISAEEKHKHFPV